jgi:LysR family transcriptional regulator, cell division regulator
VTSRAVRSLDALSTISDLKTIVFRLGCPYRQRLEALLAEMGILVSAPLEFGSIDAIVSCVAAGVGVTLLPRAVVSAAADHEVLTIHPLPHDKGHAETLFVRRRDACVSSAMRSFIDVAHSELGPLMAAA